MKWIIACQVHCSFMCLTVVHACTLGSSLESERDVHVYCMRLVCHMEKVNNEVEGFLSEYVPSIVSVHDPFHSLSSWYLQRYNRKRRLLLRLS